jgi:Na+/proline symporter
VLVSIGGVCIAMLGESLMGLLDIALSIQLSALFVPVVFGIYGRSRNQLCCILAMLFGFLVWSVTHGIELWNPTHHSFFSRMLVIPSDFYGLSASIFGYWLGLKDSSTRLKAEFVGTLDSP